MNKNFSAIFFTAIMFTLLVTGSFAQEEKRFSMLKFMSERSNLKYAKVPHKVLAFYYSWYGSPQFHSGWVHWDKVDTATKDIKASTNYPVLGPYDSYDTQVIDNHFEMAKKCGVDGMIVSWWGIKSYDDKNMPLLLERAKLKGLEMTVYFEAVRGKSSSAKINLTVKDLSYVVEKYGSHPAFLKVDGKPVIFIYGRAMGQATSSEWAQIISELNSKFPKGVALMADGFSGTNAKVFDGLHVYNSVGLAAKKTIEQINELTEKTFNSWVAMSRKDNRIACIDIIPGYDDTKIRKPGLKAERFDGELYKTMWKNAIAAEPDWILITTWNEWHEGSEIEPSIEYGDKYIKLTSEYAPAFKKKPYADVTVAVAKPAVSPALLQSLKKNLKDKMKDAKIGILPDFSSRIVGWLVDSGLNVEELQWEDLPNTSVFNVKNLPVVIYAAGENYVQSLKADLDVDNAIIKYLSDGGILLTASSQPFPFYYNEQKKPVVSAGKFGMPICGSGASDRKDYLEGDIKGWEKPPEGISANFKMDKKIFKNLKEEISFPSTGDLRWRPVINKTLSEKDIYQALARLSDKENLWFGDGIVYIEHKDSEPKGGKVVYVWFRMLDIEEYEVMLYELFDFIAGKIKK